MATLANLRDEIGDNYINYPPNADLGGEIVGQGDGVRTIFFLSQPFPLAGSITMFNWTMPASGLPSPTAYLSSAWTLSNGNQITFGTAPTAGLFIGAQYQCSIFSDTTLTYVLNNASAAGGGFGDRYVLQMAHYDIIPMIVANIERFTNYKYGNSSMDTNAEVNAQMQLRKQLLLDIQGATQVLGRQVPSLTISGIGMTPYTPQR